MAEHEDKLVEVTLTTAAYGGESLGRLADGRAVFVPFTLPGERVRVRLVEEKRGHAHAELVELLEPAPQRVQPRCRHFGECGGCHYQHISYGAQLATKTEILRDQLTRLGGLAEPNVQAAVASPLIWNYRNNLQFHLAEDGRLGFVARQGERVMPVTECHLPEHALDALWPQLEFEPLPSLERVGLRLGSDEEIQLTLESESQEIPEFFTDLDISAVFLGLERSTLLAGDDHVLMQVLGRTFRVSAGAFFQVNTAAAELLVQHMLDVLAVTPEQTVLDVYCGVGLFSAFLAERASAVVGIESSPYACYDFEINLDEFEHVSLYEGDAEDILPQLNLQPDLVLVDPPRAGLAPAVLDSILRMNPAKIAYVSCDPATLARDARRLSAGGYRLAQATPFDLFPHTYHIESVSLWEK
jgi:23S rRNA (uracil1939-C5)-methyltransferase